MVESDESLTKGETLRRRTHGLELSKVSDKLIIGQLSRDKRDTRRTNGTERNQWDAQMCVTSHQLHHQNFNNHFATWEEVIAWEEDELRAVN